MAFAFVFPGQGSQSVGMLAALAAAEPRVQGTFAEASQVLGYDLWQLVSTGPEAKLNATERTQPAMLAAGVATLRAWGAPRRRGSRAGLGPQSRGVHRAGVRRGPRVCTRRRAGAFSRAS